ncbi:FHA domain-containing protein [Microbacterium sp. USHLN186]|uniref:FHA domain-containing protein n=1 Tax=Microbacterium sp. USHLN186 TaxID=3081286 RepID=UPI00301B3AF0
MTHHTDPDEQTRTLSQEEGEQPTTTHAEWGAGDPHLRITGPESERMRFALEADEVTIGSGADCALVIPGGDPVHATIVHDANDEYVLTLHGDGEMNVDPGDGIDGDRSQILRTGARFTVGEWTLVFGREEFADHGRPYGGREGGELDDQPAQPLRPDYQGEHEADPQQHLEVKDG